MVYSGQRAGGDFLFSLLEEPLDSQIIVRYKSRGKDIKFRSYSLLNRQVGRTEGEAGERLKICSDWRWGGRVEEKAPRPPLWGRAAARQGAGWASQRPEGMLL